MYGQLSNIQRLISLKITKTCLGGGGREERGRKYWTLNTPLKVGLPLNCWKTTFTNLYYYSGVSLRFCAGGQWGFSARLFQFFLWKKVRREDENSRANWWLSLVHSRSICPVPGLNEPPVFAPGIQFFASLECHILRWLNRVMQDHEARASDLNRKLIFSFFLLFS